MWALYVCYALMAGLFISVGYLCLADKIEAYFMPKKIGKRAKAVWGIWKD
jgi:hypothetical protein